MDDLLQCPAVGAALQRWRQAPSISWRFPSLKHVCTSCANHLMWLWVLGETDDFWFGLRSQQKRFYTAIIFICCALHMWIIHVFPQWYSFCESGGGWRDCLTLACDIFHSFWKPPNMEHACEGEEEGKWHSLEKHDEKVNGTCVNRRVARISLL